MDLDVYSHPMTKLRPLLLALGLCLVVVRNIPADDIIWTMHCDSGDGTFIEDHFDTSRECHASAERENREHVKMYLDAEKRGVKNPFGKATGCQCLPKKIGAEEQ
jgi:hypothetical protein